MHLERNVRKSLNPIILFLEADDLPKAINSNLERAFRAQIWQLPLVWIISYSLLQFLIAAPFSPKFIDSLNKYTYNRICKLIITSTALQTILIWWELRISISYFRVIICDYTVMYSINTTQWKHKKNVWLQFSQQFSRILSHFLTLSLSPNNPNHMKLRSAIGFKVIKWYL